jgi:hypothetical protein
MQVTQAMFKYATVILLVLSCVLVWVGSATGSNNRIMSTPSEKVVTPVGERFSMTIALDSAVRNVRFYNVHIGFDTSVIAIDSILASPQWLATGPNFFFWKDTLDVDTVTHDSSWYVDLGSAFYGAVYHIDGYSPVATLWFTAKKPGATFLYFSDAVVLDANSTPVLSETKASIVFVCPYTFAFFGDFDHTGSLDIADLTYLISFLYLDGPPPEPLVLLGDVDCDQQVDISDLTRLIDYLYISFTPLCTLCP